MCLLHRHPISNISCRAAVCETDFAEEPVCLRGDERVSQWPSCPLWVCGQITGPQDPREPQFESQITLEKRLSNTFIIFIYRLILQAS